MSKFRALSIFLAIAYATIFPLPCLAETPHEALIRAGEAMNVGDGSTFQSVVDLDSIIGKTLDAFIEETAKPDNKNFIPKAVVFIFSQAADPGFKGQTMRRLMTSEAKAFVLNGVTSGAFAGKKLKSGSAEGILAPLLTNVSMGRKEIRGIGDGRSDGEDFILPFYLHDYGNDQDYAVVGRFHPDGDSWKLTAIENLPQIFEQLRREAQGF